jgi:hypothetical protein
MSRAVRAGKKVKRENRKGRKMKHESIIIKGIDLMNRWDNDNRSAADVAGLDTIDDEAMYEVSWPDHVITPQYNGDCEIRLIAEPIMVLRLGDGSMICDKHWAEEYPDKPEPVRGWVLGVCNHCLQSGTGRGFLKS